VEESGGRIEASVEGGRPDLLLQDVIAEVEKGVDDPLPPLVPARKTPLFRYEIGPGSPIDLSVRILQPHDPIPNLLFQAFYQSSRGMRASISAELSRNYCHSSALSLPFHFLAKDFSKEDWFFNLV
jgi:hypothetical protein